MPKFTTRATVRIRVSHFEAPFTRGPGPGVLPAFKSYGTYKTWFTGIEDTSGFDNSIGEDGIGRAWNMMIAETQSGVQFTKLAFRTIITLIHLDPPQGPLSGSVDLLCLS